MEPSTGVKVVEVCRVVPPPASSEFSLPLTAHDLLWLRFPPTQRLFFYELSSCSNPDMFYETILPRLRKSLSIALRHYLPLAGNLIWEPNSDKPIVLFSPGDGVSLTIAESLADFHYLSGDHFRKSEELHPLLPDLPATNEVVAVITLQITLFPNSGFSIGYTAHHAVLDGKSLTMFLRSWASICGGGSGDPSLSPEPIPYYDRSIIRDPEQERMRLNGWLAHNGPGNKSIKYWDIKPDSDTMLGMFHLSHESVENLKNSVLDAWGKKDIVRVSTFTVVSALTWVCLVKTQKIEPQTVIFATAADGRGRKALNPLVPSNYFGNCLLQCLAELHSDDLIRGDGVAIAAKAIADAIKGLDAKVSKNDDLSPELFLIPKGKIYGVGGSPRFELYKLDFGWGKPKKVELISIDKTGAFSLSDPSDGVSAIDVGVSLKENETEAFASLFASYIGIS